MTDEAPVAKPANKPVDELIGTVYAERYELLSTIGAGGMGVIYKARQIYLDKLVAVKLLKNNMASAKARMRFHQEARAASALTHPGIVHIVDFGVDNLERPYMVMEHVEGCTFGDLLRERLTLPFDQLLPVFLEIADALAAAHSAGVIHRDLKPSNIMVVTTDDGAVHIKILDFGIAKMYDAQDQTIQSLTKTGEALGTPLYMSPEQIRSQKVTARSDLYSLGCMLYACLTGTPPFVGPNKLETMEKHCSEQAAPFAEAAPEITFPDGLEALVMRLIEKDPANRFASVDEFSQALVALAQKNKLLPKIDALAVPSGELYLTGLIPPISLEETAIDAGVAAVRKPAYSGAFLAPSPERSLWQKLALPVVALLIVISAGGAALFFFGDHMSGGNAASTAKNVSFSPKARVVKLPEDFKIADKTWRALGASEFLSTLVSVDNAMTDAQVELVSKSQTIKVLKIESDKITDASVPYFLKMPMLEGLYLRRSRITSRGLAAIARSQTLRALEISNSNLTSAEVQGLCAGGTTLTSLTLKNNDLDDSVAGILDCLTRLNYLNVQGNARISPRFFDKLPALVEQKCFFDTVPVANDHGFH